VRIPTLKHPLALSLLAASLLSGCGSTPSGSVAGVAPTTVSGWLERAANSSLDTRSGYYLEAANLTIMQQDYQQAATILPKISPSSTQQQTRLSLYQTEASLAVEDYQTAQAALSVVNQDLLAAAEFTRWLNAKQRVLEEDELYSEAVLLLASHFQRYGSTQQSKAEAIWQLLNHLQTEHPSLLVRPWQQLHHTVTQAGSAVQLQRELKQWRVRYPEHPATLALSPQMAQLVETDYTSPTQIAVLLPLTGKYRRAGMAIRDGLLQSWFSHPESQTRISLYDTNSDSISNLYQQAKQAGADAIIGPLLKESVESLLNVDDQQTPTLILNRSSEEHSNKQLIYFALPPEAEGGQTAAWLEQNGITHPMLLTTPGNGHRRLIDGFNQYHTEKLTQQPDGEQQEPPVVYELGAPADFQTAIENALGLSESKKRIAQLQQLTGIKLESQPRSRRDLDAVYVAASPADSRLVKSFVDVTVSPFSQRLPVYIGSRGHAGYRNELEGARIGDLAINISPQQAELKQHIMTQHPGWKASDLRLFALGYDALNLVEQIGLIRYLPEFRLQGLSGTLRVSDSGNIEVEMPWAEYRNGSLRPIVTQL